jgi:Zn-dependent peptidase ImmA (M78 family)
MNQSQPKKRRTVLALLRDLVPKRALTWREAERIVELQANRMREILNLDQPKLPEEAISELPRIEVRRESDLPVSGLTYWDSGCWVIALNADEPSGRQRFSLAHEFRHILDHTERQWLYLDGRVLSRSEQAERLADYFAGCLLMPKRWVKRLFGERNSLIWLADAFCVTPRAMHVRLNQLGLIELTPRCDWSVRKRNGTGYYRRGLREGVAA